jgi:hypothetical protein
VIVGWVEARSADTRRREMIGIVELVLTKVNGLNPSYFGNAMQG